MTEEQARRHAKALALGMGITFCVVRSREGRFLPVQLPSEDCEILAMIAPPDDASGMMGASAHGANAES